MWGLLRACGPLSLLAAGVVLTVGGVLVEDLRAAVAGLAIEAVLLPVLIGRAGFPLVRLVPGLIAVAAVSWSNWLLADPRSVEAAAAAGARLAFFVLPSLVFVSFVDPLTLGDHLGRRLRLPARPVLAGVAALERLESLARDWDDLGRARHIRGLGPGRGPVQRVRHLCGMTLALIVEAVRAAGRMTVAMEARGYSASHRGGPPRTWSQPAPWTRHDTTLMLLAAVVASVPALVQIWS